MKNYYIAFIISFILNFNIINNIEPSIYANITDNIYEKIEETIEHFLNDDKMKKCINIMKESFKGKFKYSYLTKLFFDSSPNFEDIKNYYYCYNNLYTNVNKDIFENLTFIVIKYTDKAKNNYTEYENSFNSFSKVFGACIPQGCSDDEYYNIIEYINAKYELIDGNIIGVVNLKPLKSYSFFEKFSQILIPFLMILFILLLIEIRYISGFFWSLFGFIITKLNKKKYGEENIIKLLKKNKLSQIDNINSFMKLSSNIEEVMPGNKESQISNENGLQIVVGLRGFFIIGLFLGLTLQNIFTTPTRIFDNKQYKKYMNTKLYCFLFFFARISQKMLYALSGFELTFKLLFYFDNQLYKKFVSSVQTIDLNNMNLNKYEEENSSHNNSFTLSQNNFGKKNKIKLNNLENINISKNKLNSSKDNLINKKPNSNKLKSMKSESINEEDDDEEYEEFEGDEESDENNEEEKKTTNLINQKRKKINEKEIVINNQKNINIRNNRANSNKSKDEKPKKFMSSIERGKIYLQNHNKLPFQALLSFHLRQSYLYFIFIFSILYFIFWQTQYFAHLYERGTLWMIITSEIKEYFNSTIILGTMLLFAGTCIPLRNYYNFFIPAMNEIFFYIFGTSLIYFCYKKNSRLDIILIFLSFLVILVKFIIFLIFRDNKNYLYRPSLDFMQYNNYFFIQMHFLNLSYYCIGMIVGLANYSLQNDIKKKKIVKEFVKLPRKLYFIIKRKYNFIFGLAFFIIFLFIDIFLYQIYLFLNGKNRKDPNVEVDYFKSDFINIFNLIDCEIIIACTFILTIIVFYSSISFLRDKFKASFWIILSRIYFTILLTAPMQSNWFLFQFAERIDLNIIWAGYVLTLTFIISFVSSIAIYLFFQVPLKKLTKIIYVEKNKIYDELNNLKGNGRSGSISYDDSSSIDLNANNTRLLINGRKASGDSNDENDVIRSDLILVYENYNENTSNENDI